jgi:antimicrobial peptide system SdpA family protein
MATINGSKLAYTLLPQGWAFFTRSPRELVFEGYAKVNGKWIKITNNNFSIENDFGFSREGRSISWSLMQLAMAIPEKNWNFDREFDVENFKNLTCDTLTFNNFKSSEIGVVAYNILPWAWVDNPSKTKIIYKTCRVFIP